MNQDTQKEFEMCPCGTFPTELYIVDGGQGGKYALAYPSCCGDWHIEFRTEYNDFKSEKCKELARFAWNNAPRAATQAQHDKHQAEIAMLREALKIGASYIYSVREEQPRNSEVEKQCDVDAKILTEALSTPPTKWLENKLAEAVSRYNWLRENGCSNSKSGSKAVIGNAKQAKVSFSYWCTPDELDALIDDAIRNKEKA